MTHKNTDGQVAEVRAPIEDDDTGTWISKELTRVEETNLAFYEAFSARDIERMAQIWSHSPHARCIHPGWELVIGWSDIRQSWVEIFRTIESIDFEIEDVHVEVAGRNAWANLVAQVTISTDEGERFQATVVTTNIFELADGHWRMVLHHSSNFSEDDEEEDEGGEEMEAAGDFEPN